METDLTNLRIVSKDALAIEREADGGWPAEVLVWLSDLLPGHPNHREDLDPHFDSLYRIAMAVGLVRWSDKGEAG